MQLGEVAHGFVDHGPGCGVNGALVVVNQAQGGGLAAAGRQRGTRTRTHANMAPQRGRYFEPHQHVQRLARDLRVHGVHVEQLRRLDGALQPRLGDFVEDDALRGRNRQTEQAARMVSNASALAVVVGHQVRFFALCDQRLYLLNLRRLGIHHMELRHGGKRGVNVVQSGDLSHVSEGGHARVLVRAQVTHDGAAFGRRLHDEQDFIAVAVA